MRNRISPTLVQAEEAAEEGGQAAVRRPALVRQGPGKHVRARLEDLQGGLQHRHQGRQLKT